MDRGSSTAAVPSAAAAGARPVASAAGRARLPPVGPARDDAFGRRGAAAQDCARAGSGGEGEAAGAPTPQSWAAPPPPPPWRTGGPFAPGPPAGWTRGRKLYILDEPTTGLHLDDVRTLCRVLDRLVDAGHTVLVIEHHLDVVKRADWIIDMGPGAGEAGGRVVAQGTPESVARVAGSATGRYLRDLG